MPSMGESNRRLMWHGMFLFLLGLSTGFVEPRFQHTDGSGGSPGRRHEWHFPDRSGRNMDRGEAVAWAESGDVFLVALSTAT